MFPGIEDLCNKRDELQKQIILEEEEKCKIQNDLRILTERLARINESLAKKIASRNEYDKTISETEAAYMKVKHILFTYDIQFDDTLGVTVLFDRNFQTILSTTRNRAVIG